MASANSLKSNLGFDPEALHRKYLEERDRRLEDNSREYLDLKGEFADFAIDPYVEPGFTRDSLEEDVDAVVLGAGLAGLMTAVNLVRSGVANFRIIEQAGDFGGTWYWNRYPGIRCDVESYTYIPLLEEVDTIPSEKYAEGKEIFAHCQAIGRKFGLYDRALFQTVVKSIRWDDGSARWIIATNRGDTIRSRHVVVSSGPLHKPKLPNIPGISDFKGISFHTSRWNYDYTGGDSSGDLTKLAGKKVALVGTGATGIQVFPHLARWAEHVYLIQRTPSAVDRRNNRPTDIDWYRGQEPGWQQRRIDNFCLTTMGVPQEENLVNDCWTDITTLRSRLDDSEDESIRNASPDERAQLADYMKMEQLRARVSEIVLDPATAESLKPWYNLFCKRPLFSDEYYPVFNQPNVTLVDTHGKGVERITESAIIVNGQSYAVDCIIFATGFRAAVYSHRSGGYEVIGRGGVTLEEHWSDGQKSVHGVRTSRFPNFHIVGSISQASASFNFPQVTFFQTEQAARLIANCLRDNVRSIEVTPEAEQRWAEQMTAKAHANTRFEVECTPGYYNGEGKAKPGTSLFSAQYGGGPVEYIGLLDRWVEQGVKEDARVEY